MASMIGSGPSGRYEVYARHQAARCRWCHLEMGGIGEDSGRPAGQGRYVQVCPGCPGVETAYDLCWPPKPVPPPLVEIVEPRLPPVLAWGLVMAALLLLALLLLCIEGAL